MIFNNKINSVIIPGNKKTGDQYIQCQIAKIASQLSHAHYSQ